jgi:hypothetical protein
MSSDVVSITPLEQRQLNVIVRRLEQVEPVVDAIYRATASLPAADRLAVTQRLEHIGRAQRGQWDVGQPTSGELPAAA